jgi:hypothetical protein
MLKSRLLRSGRHCSARQANGNISYNVKSSNPYGVPPACEHPVFVGVPPIHGNNLLPLVAIQHVLPEPLEHEGRECENSCRTPTNYGRPQHSNGIQLCRQGYRDRLIPTPLRPPMPCARRGAPWGRPSAHNAQVGRPPPRRSDRGRSPAKHAVVPRAYFVCLVSAGVGHRVQREATIA